MTLEQSDSEPRPGGSEFYSIYEKFPLGAEPYLITGSAGDLVACPHTNRVFNGVFHGPHRAANGDEDAAQGMCGQRFGAAAELPLGAERYVSAGSAGDPSSPVFLRTASSTERLPVYFRDDSSEPGMK